MTLLAHHLDPIVAIATAAGRAAVGIVRVSSAVALDDFIAALLPGRTLQPRHAHYLPVPDAQGAPIDHAIVLHFPAPHSYSGEHVLEIQAHGGPVVLDRIVARCLQIAQPTLPRLRLAGPGEFTQRAYLNGKMDLTQAEAVADLIDATTEAAARSASRSLEGAFSREVQRLRQAAIALQTLVEATLDFPEEEIDFLERADAAGQLSALLTQLRHVRARAHDGAVLRQGLRVVIAGQPNAGKSALLNALAGRELAIVTPIAGTTRDRLEQTIHIAGVPLHIIDTAGLRDDAADAVERIGIERAWAAAADADAIIFLHDLSRQHLPEYQSEDEKITKNLQIKIPVKTPILHVGNKIDLIHNLENIKKQNQNPNNLYISAQNGTGLDDLRAALLNIAGFSGQSQETIFTARARHLTALEKTQNHLHNAQQHLLHPEPELDILAEELRLAQNHLGEITGEFTNDDLLGAIFSQFCIGK